MPDLLDDATIEQKLTGLPDWEYAGGALRKTWQLKGFLSTMTFANAIAHLAHRANHHPDLENHYNRVRVALHTWNENAVTDKDIALAREIESVAETT